MVDQLMEISQLHWRPVIAQSGELTFGWMKLKPMHIPSILLPIAQKVRLAQSRNEGINIKIKTGI